MIQETLSMRGKRRITHLDQLSARGHGKDRDPTPERAQTHQEGGWVDLEFRGHRNTICIDRGIQGDLCKICRTTFRSRRVRSIKSIRISQILSILTQIPTTRTTSQDPVTLELERPTKMMFLPWCKPRMALVSPPTPPLKPSSLTKCLSTSPSAQRVAPLADKLLQTPQSSTSPPPKSALTTKTKAPSVSRSPSASWTSN